MAIRVYVLDGGDPMDSENTPNSFLSKKRKRCYDKLVLIWVVGYRLNRLDEPVFMAVPKSILTEFDIHYRLESCV